MTTTSSVDAPVKEGTFTADGAIYLKVRGYQRGARFNTIYLSGTFGSGTATVEISPDDGTTWFAVPDAALTSAGFVDIQARFNHMRVSLSGSSGPSLNVWGR